MTIARLLLDTCNTYRGGVMFRKMMCLLGLHNTKLVVGHGAPKMVCKDCRKITMM